MWTPDWLADDCDSCNTTLLFHHQPIRGRSNIQQPSPHILPMKTLSPEPSTSLGFLSPSHLFSLLVLVQSLSRVWLFVTPWTASPSFTCSNWCPLSWGCHPTISSSVGPFSSCLQSFPTSGSFPVSWLFTSGGQSIGASASVLPVNIQGLFPLGLTGLIDWSN